MSAAVVVLGGVLVLVVLVIAFALCRKDSVCAAVWLRPFGFFLLARNNESEQKRK